MNSTFGERLVTSVREYLKQNNLTSLGQINAPILKDLADRLYDHVQLVEKQDRAKKRMSGKDRSVLFDALAGACGCNPKEMPERQARACAVAVSEIIKVMPDVQPEEFAARAARYRVIYREAALTPSSLCAHWGECGAPNGKPFHAKPDPKKSAPPIPEPPGWRHVIEHDSEDAMYFTAAWESIMPFYQTRIASKCRKAEAT